MGCTSSSHHSSENAWQEVTPKERPSSKTKPQMKNPKMSAPTPTTQKTPSPSPMSSSSLRLDQVNLNSVPGPPTPLGGTPGGNKKLTLLQTRSMNSKLSMQSSDQSLVCSVGGSAYGKNSFPSLDTSILVEVPDDFRRKYKITSVMAEKDVASFAFRGAVAVDEDGTTNDEFSTHSDKGDEAGVILYKGIDRQKKYVIVEKTQTSMFKNTMQVEYFDRIDNLRDLSIDSIPTILDVFDTPHDYTIVFQYGVGKSLAELLSQRGAVSDPEALKAMVLALVDTLKHMHKQNIAHRHICAEQLIVSRFNHFSRARDLTVTGLSRVVRVPPPRSSSPTKITPNFSTFVEAPAAVPEQFLDVFSAPELSQPGHGLEVDLYSLGVVVYSLLCGSVPSSRREVRVESLSCAPSLKRLISSLLRPDPLQRPSLRRVEKYFVRSFIHDQLKLERKWEELELNDVEVAPVLLSESASSLATSDKSVTSGNSSVRSSISSTVLSDSSGVGSKGRGEGGVTQEDCLRMLDLALVTPPHQEL